jgi:hypothetical protein
MFSRVLTSALVGGALGCIAAFLMFGRSKVPGNDPRNLLTLMVPAFALIGVILGALDGVLFSVLDRFKK